MDNQIVINPTTIAPRSIDTITTEIISLKNQAKTFKVKTLRSG